jgi:phosphoribosylformylglycinamidine synthase I
VSAKIGVITFPGSNGDHDAWYAFDQVLGVPARLVDYRETDLDEFELVVLPGGFSYGDHLRCGAIARFAPVVEPLRAFAARGGPVIGICNGFQVLTEAHLLPGAMLRNKSLLFHCDWVTVKIETARSIWTQGIEPGSVLRLPVAHGEGAYFADAETLERLEEHDHVVFRYCDERGNSNDAANFNGSSNGIAGIINERGNVLGLMPHPERAVEAVLGGDDGLAILRSAFASVNAAV